MFNMVNEQQRFESFYKINGTCFEWQGYLDKDGYGTFYFRKKNRKAHRVAYFLKYGDIPKGMVIDHRCKNRKCVNAEHFKLVTKLENTLHNSLSVGAINKAKTHCKFGHPFDKKYGKQRYCSICQNEKAKRFHKKWKDEANSVLC